jgi:hypothetical protein
LLVGALGPSAQTPPGAPPSTFSRWWWALPDLQLRHLLGAHRRCFHVDGERSQTFSSSTSRGSVVNVFTLVMDAPESSAPAPPEGPPPKFSRWWWALSDLQLWHLPGVHRRYFHVAGGCSRTFSSGTSRRPTVDIFTLLVGAPGPSGPTPPKGPPSMFSR